jgi:2-oxo-4-hydroxy-4-carboxy--5-ureidoimidazoline (OHCU) decarboxylase
VFEKWRIEPVNWAKTDPDLDPIRDHPRFKAILEAAEARLAHSSAKERARSGNDDSSACG